MHPCMHTPMHTHPRIHTQTHTYTHTEHTNFPEQNINKPPAQNHDTDFTCTKRGIWKPSKFLVTLLKLAMYTHMMVE